MNAIIRRLFFVSGVAGLLAIFVGRDGGYGGIQLCGRWDFVLGIPFIG